jgi:hypothetical protein
MCSILENAGSSPENYRGRSLSITGRRLDKRGILRKVFGKLKRFGKLPSAKMPFFQMRPGQKFPILPIFPFIDVCIVDRRTHGPQAADEDTPGCQRDYATRKVQLPCPAHKKTQNAAPAIVDEAAGLQSRFITLPGHLPGSDWCDRAGRIAR